MAAIPDFVAGLGAHGEPAALGIFGGTFDPIHRGHIEVALQAKEQLDLDAVLMVPTATPVFKKGAEHRVTPAVIRLAMCQEALRGYEGLGVSSIEVDRGGDTYTIDTLNELRAAFPENVKLWFIVGMDVALTLPKWKAASQVAALASVAVVGRPGYELEEETFAAVRAAGFNVALLDVSGPDISSTQICERVRSGKGLDDLVPQSTEALIKGLGLYRYYDLEDPRAIHDYFANLHKKGVKVRREGVKEPKGSKAQKKLKDAKGSEGAKASNDAKDPLSDKFFKLRRKELKLRLKPERYEHSLGVSQAAVALARTYGLDEPSARIAGLLHDWDKCFDNQTMVKRAHQLDVARLLPGTTADDMPWLLHGYTAAASLPDRFPALSPQILQSIAWHTTASQEMEPFDMVVYMADMLDPSRDFAGLDELRALVGKISLEDLFVRLYAYTFDSLLKHAASFYPLTDQIWNHYIARAFSRALEGKDDK